MRASNAMWERILIEQSAIVILLWSDSTSGLDAARHRRHQWRPKTRLHFVQPGYGQTAIWYLSGGAVAGGAYGPTLPVGYTLVSP